MESKPTSSRNASFSVATARTDVIAGLVSSALAIPLAMAFGMFAFVTLGDEYFAYGAMAGLVSAVIAGCVCRCDAKVRCARGRVGTHAIHILGRRRYLQSEKSRVDVTGRAKGIGIQPCGRFFAKVFARVSREATSAHSRAPPVYVFRVSRFAFLRRTPGPATVLRR